MAATRLIVLFNLKPGRSAADYEAWARATDLPTVKALPSVRDFSVFKVAGVLGAADAAPPYQYVEIIDIRNMAHFGEEVGSATMQKIAAEFQAWAEPVFLTTEPLEA